MILSFYQTEVVELILYVLGEIVNIIHMRFVKLITPIAIFSLLLLILSASGKAIASNILPEVYINEIRVDQPGADLNEYAELIGVPNTALDGLSYIVIGDGSGTASGTIEYVVDLSGQAIPDSGYFLIAKLTLPGGKTTHTTEQSFERDNVTHMLVAGFTGSDDDDLDTDDDGVLDVTPWTAIVDAVSLVGVDVPPAGSEHVYATGLGYPTVGPDGDNAPAHIYRSTATNPRTLSDVWYIGDVAYGTKDTPGAINAVPTAVGISQKAAANHNIGYSVASLVVLTTATLYLRTRHVRRAGSA